MIPWLINSMLCRLFFNTDLLHAFRRVPYSDKSKNHSQLGNFHKVYPQNLPVSVPLLQSFS